MRPIYQELILPNLAYIGGGGEIAYWLERKSQFEAFGIPFPMLVRRNSALIISSQIKKKIDKIGLDSAHFLLNRDELIKLYLSNRSDEDYELKEEGIELSALFNKLAEKAKRADASLEQFTLAEGAKQMKSLKMISSKITKAMKQKNDVSLNQIDKIGEKLFPQGKIQERYDSFIPYFLKYGKSWFYELLENLNPLNKSFLIIEQE